MRDPGDEWVTGQQIIEAILQSMREGIEDLSTRKHVPGHFWVSLDSTVWMRVEGILNQLQEEASQALDEALTLLNQGGRRGWLPSLPLLIQRGADRFRHRRRGWPRYVMKPQVAWEMTFLLETDPLVKAGEIVVETSLSYPARLSLGTELTTKRVRSVYRVIDLHQEGGKEGPTLQFRMISFTYPLPTSSGSANKMPRGAILAQLEYQDGDQWRSSPMTKRSIVIGRGGRGIWTDIKLPPLAGISREHLSIRYDSGAFSIKDLSTFGTMIDGYPIPNSGKRTGFQLNDPHGWVPLPRRCQISLAGVLSLEFIAVDQG
jgi:hypothetical protein